MTVQSDVYVIILLTILLGIGIVAISKKIDSWIRYRSRMDCLQWSLWACRR